VRPGDKFAGRYVLREVIGAGRSGDVWRAHDSVVGQDVALKPESVVGDREAAVRRLLGEPRAMAKFRDHPHVVTLYDVVAVPHNGVETYWFVMEHVPGGGLDQRPPMSPAQVARIGAQLADALVALHESGIVHCDIKPANIGLTRRGTAKLLDFGAAHRFAGAETVTVNGPFSYTPDYAAPELAQGNIPRPASDVFCLGATLYALVTGAPPRGSDPATVGGEPTTTGTTTGEDLGRLSYWKAEQGFVEMNVAAVGPLYPVLAVMLQRDPRRRPDAVEVRRLLAGIAGPDSYAPRSISSERPRRRWPLLAGAATAGAALLTLGLVVIPGDDDGGEVEAGPGRPGQPTVAETAETAETAPTDDDAPKNTGPDLIGDPHTANVCALAQPADFGSWGDAGLDPDYGNFDRCDMLIEQTGGGRVDVEIHLQQGEQPERSEPAIEIGGIGIHEQPPESDQCERLLLPIGADPEGIIVGIRVNVGEEPVEGGSGTLCAVANQAAETAARTLADGPIPRHSGYPDNSLAKKNACALLEAEELTAAVPGINTEPDEIGVANWECQWESSVDELEARVQFDRDQPPKRNSDGDYPLELDKYDAIVDEGGNGDDTCTVFLQYREYIGQNGETAAEMVRLIVGGQRTMDQRCQMATDLTRSVASHLPPP
jgi:hypothetical protein